MLCSGDSIAVYGWVKLVPILSLVWSLQRYVNWRVINLRQYFNSIVKVYGMLVVLVRGSFK